MNIRMMVGAMAASAMMGISAFAGPQEEAAQAAALQWLALTDSGRYEASWQLAADFFRKSIASPQWEQALTTVRQPLGALVSRKLKSAQVATNLPGAPKGEYVVLQFETEFAGKPQAVETVTPTKELDGAWRVSGYFIK